MGHTLKPLVVITLKKLSVTISVISDLVGIWIYAQIPVTKKRVLVIAPLLVATLAASVPSLMHRTTQCWLARHLGCCLAIRNASLAAAVGSCWCR